MEPKIEPQGFIPKRPTNFQQHQRRIELLILEGMHDGKGWRPEAFPRYNELELLEHAPSSPAAPLSLSADQIKPMVERFLQWKLPENFNPDGGISFKKTFNDHTAHPMKHEPVGTNLFDFNQAEEMIRYVIEAGSPAAPTPHMSAAEFYRRVWIKENASDPRGDWPIRMAEAYAAYRLKTLVAAAEDLLRFVTNPQNIPANNLRRHIEKLRTTPDAATPSPCCANPNMVVKGVCDRNRSLHMIGDACRNPRPTHNVCLNCGKEEKI